MSKPKIGVFIGSLRKESYSRKIARELESFALDKMDFKEIELGGLELYNQDFDDENKPTVNWMRFREQVKALDGVLFVTPEYNRSVPAVLKNALDVGSRPYGKSVWDGKPGAVASVSPGGLGGFGANHHLRQSLVFLNIPALPKGGRLAIETSNVVLDEDYASIHKAATPGPYVQLSVSDSGCGMDKRTQERIFEPFFTTKEVGKGTGLGLSTVYGIVKQSGGSIWVYSELGQGTTFKIYLPMALTEAEIATCDTEEIPSQPMGNGTILVVEDEAALRKIAVRTLEAVGYTVLSAADGDEALHVSSLHQGEILLLLTDVVMPRMGGSVLAQKLSLTRPSLKVVYMSGYTDDTIVHHGVLDKGTHFISKPFTAEDLTTMVRNVLDGGNEDLSARQGRPLGGEGEGI